MMILQNKIKFKLFLLFLGLFFVPLPLVYLGSFDIIPKFIIGFLNKIPWVILTFSMTLLGVFKILTFVLNILHKPIFHGIIRKKLSTDKIFFASKNIFDVKKFSFIFLVIMISTFSISISFTNFNSTDITLLDYSKFAFAGFVMGLAGIITFPLFILSSFNLRIFFKSNMIVQKLESPLTRLVFVIPFFAIVRIFLDTFFSSNDLFQTFSNLSNTLIQSQVFLLDFIIMAFVLSLIHLVCLYAIQKDLLDYFKMHGIENGKINYDSN